MTQIKLITVATHTHGELENLLHNPFNIEITLLGYGKEWTGFRMKFEEILQYMYESNLDDDDIVVFLDGFDSLIHKDPSNLLELFREYNCRVLFSEDNYDNPFIASMWNKCVDNSVANTGLYMGYVKELKILLRMPNL